VVALEPPAKPPDTELKVVVSGIQITQAVLVEIKPPPKPPDAVQSGTILLRRVPPPKPPDRGDSGNGKREEKTEANLRVVIPGGDA
ncbi:hypothetical protein A2U01_0051938, partial [Trifolium medium]|nr:hypothetical protein [Trifolium medium]